MTGCELYHGFRNPLLGSPSKDLPRHLAVVGAGTIGPDIGYYMKTALPDITLTIIDISEEALEGVLPPFEGYSQKGVKRGKITAEKAERVLANVVTSSDYDALKDADPVSYTHLTLPTNRE